MSGFDYGDEDTGPTTWTGEERRRIIEMTESEWRTLIIQHLIRQHKMLKQISKAMEFYTAGKVFAKVLGWSVGIAGGISLVYTALHDKFK